MRGHREIKWGGCKSRKGGHLEGARQTLFLNKEINPKDISHEITWIVDCYSAGIEIHSFCGIPRFIIVFTKGCLWIVYRTSSTQSTASDTVSLRCILISSFHTHLSLPNALFSSGFYSFLIFHTPAACPPPSKFIYLIVLTI